MKQELKKERHSTKRWSKNLLCPVRETVGEEQWMSYSSDLEANPKILLCYYVMLLCYVMFMLYYYVMLLLNFFGTELICPVFLCHLVLCKMQRLITIVFHGIGPEESQDFLKTFPAALRTL